MDDPVIPEAPAVPPVLVTYAIDEPVYPEASSSCGPVPFSCLGFPAEDQWVFATPSNGTLTALHATVTQADGYPETITWSLDCRSPSNETGLCRLPLAEGAGTLPLAIDVEGVRLPPLTDVTVRLVVPTVGVPGADLGAEIVRSPLAPRFIGTASLELAGNSTLAPVSLAFDGLSGPCPQDPGCPYFPGGSVFETGPIGTVRALNLTMTWDSTSELDRVLGLRITTATCAVSCKEPAFVTGPSPLVASFPSGLWEGLILHVVHPGPEGGPYIIDNPAGTRTPVHLEGTAWVEPAEDDA